MGNLHRGPKPSAFLALLGAVVVAHVAEGAWQHLGTSETVLLGLFGVPVGQLVAIGVFGGAFTVRTESGWAWEPVNSGLQGLAMVGGVLLALAGLIWGQDALHLLIVAS